VDQDFGLVELSIHFVSLVCVLLIGYALLTRNMFITGTSIASFVENIGGGPGSREHSSFMSMVTPADGTEWLKMFVDELFADEDLMQKRHYESHEQWGGCPRTWRMTNNFGRSMVEVRHPLQHTPLLFLASMYYYEPVLSLRA
jgi:hypothetical protein